VLLGVCGWDSFVCFEALCAFYVYLEALALFDIYILLIKKKKLFGVTWVMLGRMRECLGSWRGQRGNRTSMKIWRMVPLCVMWCLWR
jgi:hypothetical protein